MPGDAQLIHELLFIYDGSLPTVEALLKVIIVIR